MSIKRFNFHHFLPVWFRFLFRFLMTFCRFPLPWQRNFRARKTRIQISLCFRTENLIENLFIKKQNKRMEPAGHLWKTGTNESIKSRDVCFFGGCSEGFIFEWIHLLTLWNCHFFSRTGTENAKPIER